MRQRALEADIVVVNHHLLCADLAVKESSNYGQVIPPYDTVILDEAHLLEDVATQYFGVAVSSHRVEDVCRDVERELKAAELDAREVRAEVEAVRHRADRFFGLLARGEGRRLAAGWMTSRHAEESKALLLRLAGLKTAILATPDRPEALNGLALRAQGLRDELRFVLEAEDDGHVYFVETRGRGVFLKATPIDVAERLQEVLFSQVRAAVLTSATLAVDGGFDVPPVAPRPRRGRRAAPVFALRLRGAGDPLRAPAHARAAVAGLRRACGRGGGGAARAVAGAAPSCSSRATRT